MFRLLFDVTFQVREYSNILHTKHVYDIRLRHFQEARNLYGEIETTHDISFVGGAFPRDIKSAFSEGILPPRVRMCIFPRPI